MLHRLQKTARLVPKVSAACLAVFFCLRVEQVNRVLAALSESPTNIPIDSWISQIAAELEAEEKLEVAKWQESAKTIPEKIRRVAS